MFIYYDSYIVHGYNLKRLRPHSTHIVNGSNIIEIPITSSKQPIRDTLGLIIYQVESINSAMM